jgi:hypothetical protein
MTQQHQIPQPTLPDPFRPPPKRNHHSWLWAGLGLAIAATVVLGVNYGPQIIQAPTTHTVVYQVEADAAYGSGRTGTYTIQTDNGGTSQGTGLLPMTGTYTQFHTGDFVYVSVQNQQGAGSVTCRILVDGAVISENTSTGGYTIATCSSRVP